LQGLKFVGNFVGDSGCKGSGIFKKYVDSDFLRLFSEDKGIVDGTKANFKPC
jgi:hypothetical protein